MLLIDSVRLTGYRGWGSSFAVCSHWPNILQQGLLSDVYADQNPLLYLWLSVSLTLFISPSSYLFLSRYFSRHLLASLILHSLSPSLLLTRLLQSSYKKEHSEIWHCIIMPQTCTYHSLAAALLCWNVIDPATIHVRRVLLAVNTVWKPQGRRMGMLWGLWLKGVRMKHLKVHLASCLRRQCCALHEWSPMQMALLRVIGGGTVLPLSNIGSCSLMPSCKGDSELCPPVYLMSPPHCWSMPTLSRCLCAHQ